MLNILYICTHNRCRSVLSEAITNNKGAGKLFAKSAGSTPAGEVHPLTLKYLAEAGYSIDGLTSKSWDDEMIQDFAPDVVITVCDNAQGEACPIWLGKIPKLHWGLSDPSKRANENGDTPEVQQAFMDTIAEIEQRVERLLAIAGLPKEEQESALTSLVNE